MTLFVLARDTAYADSDTFDTSSRDRPLCVPLLPVFPALILHDRPVGRFFDSTRIVMEKLKIPLHVSPGLPGEEGRNWCMTTEHEEVAGKASFVV